MFQKKGIDVSAHQGIINWIKVKGNIDFAIIRAGFGRNNIDAQFHRNAKACEELGIDFGVYWFSYAYNENMAKLEADYACDAIENYKLSYPVCFDFEYASYNYAVKNGHALRHSDLAKIATAFLSRVKERGYYPMNYTNPDFLNKGFSELVGKFDTWLAHWGIYEPSKPCEVWQYTSDGKIPGIHGRVDMDYSFKDYPGIISGINSDIQKVEVIKNEKLEKIKNDMFDNYYSIAEEVIKGKWGNGKDRKDKIKKFGYDYTYIQNIVNAILKG